MKTYSLTFLGRETGTIGIFHHCEITVQAENTDTAKLAVYNTHEHISKLDCREITRKELYTLRNKITRLVNASAKAWERGSNSGNNATLAQCTREENDLATRAEALLSRHCPGVTMDWPGLYPCYKVPGKGEEHTVEGALCSFFDLPRNYFKQY